MQELRARSTCFFRRVVRRKRPNFEFDQIKGARSDALVYRRNRRHRLSAIAHSLARQWIFVHRDWQDTISVGTILAGHDSYDAVKRARLGNIEADDLAVAAGAAEDARRQCVGDFEIGSITCSPGDLLQAVNQWHPGARGARVAIRTGAHDGISAAALTDSMIFT